MKKLVLGLAVVALVAVAGFAGTRAFFSDTEVSQGNVFSAGSLDLQVAVQGRSGAENGADHDYITLADNEATFNFANLMPGDMGTGDLGLRSTQNAWACMSGEMNDSSDAQMADNVEIGFWVDDNNDGLIQYGDEQATFRPMSIAQFANGQYYPVQDSVVGGDALDANTNYHQGYAVCFGEFETDSEGNVVINDSGLPTCDGASVPNDVQGDQVRGALSFYAEQAANNANFTCGAINNPMVVAENFNTNNSASYKGVNVGWHLDNFTDVSAVEVSLYRAGETDPFVTNTGTQDLLDLIASGTTQLSTPFVISPDDYSDQYWNFGDYDWTTNDKPAKAVITVTQYGQEYSATNDNLAEPNGWTFDSLF